MKIAGCGASLTALALFTVVPLFAGGPVYADSTAATTDATCVMSAHGIFATAVAGIAVSNALSMTGTVACVDVGGAPGATGTFERTVTMPAAECTGDELGDTSTTRVAWSDGAVSTFNFDKTSVVKVSGTASLAVSGAVTDDSARYASDTISGGGLSVGAGCGTPTGEAALDSTLVVRLTH